MYSVFSNICLGIFIVLVLIVIYKYIKKKEISDNSKVLGFVEKHYKIIFIIILLVFLFTRLYTLTSNPYKIFIDEVSIAYDAYSIAEYGVDRYQNIYPLYFLNIDGGQSAMYTYLAASLIKIFGYSLFVIRIPAVLGGLLTLISCYLLGKEIKGKSFGLLVASLITICPYFIMSSRWGLDCYLMMGFFSISIYVLLKAIKAGKKYMYIISGILFGLTLYTYALSYMIVPVVLLSILIYLIYLKKVTLKQVIYFCIPFIILFIPLILNVLINMGILSEIKTRFFSIPKMNSDRVAEVGLNYVIENLKSFYTYFTYRTYPAEYFDYGTLYIFSIPFIILGFVCAIKRCLKSKKEFNMYIIVLLTFVAGFVALLFVKESYLGIYKGNMLFVFLAIFLALGLCAVFKHIKYSWVLVAVVYLIAFTSFNYYYFTENSSYECEDTKVLSNDYMAAVENAYSKGKEIFIELDVGAARWNILYIGLATKMSPYFYTETEDHMQNIYFYVPFDYSKDKIYILIDRDHYDEFIEHGFTCNKYGSVYEYYYKE